MITPPAVSPAPNGRRRSCSINSSLTMDHLLTASSLRVAMDYHALKTPHNRSLPSSCDKSFLEACGLQRSGQSSFPVAVILPSIAHVQVPSTSGSRRARPAKISQRTMPLPSLLMCPWVSLFALWRRRLADCSRIRLKATNDGIRDVRPPLYVQVLNN